MKRTITGSKEDFLELLQKRRDEADLTAGRRELPTTTRSRHTGIKQGLDYATAAVRDWVMPEPPKTWLYGLTADEWLHLASEGQDSEIAPCCGNISAVRELLQALATCQASYDGWMQAALGQQLLEAIGEGGDGEEGEHGLLDEKTFPLLHRVLEGIRAQLAKQHEEQQARQAQADSPATS